MANHQFDGNCSLQTTDTDVMIVAKRDIKRGQEITFCYCTFPNGGVLYGFSSFPLRVWWSTDSSCGGAAHFYFRYGFAIPEHDNDVLHLHPHCQDEKPLLGLHKGRWAKFLREAGDMVRAGPRRSRVASSLAQVGEAADEDGSHGVGRDEELQRASHANAWAARQVEASERFLEDAEHSAAARGYVEERRLMLLEAVHLTRDYMAFLATLSRDIDDSLHTDWKLRCPSVIVKCCCQMVIPLQLFDSWLHSKKCWVYSQVNPKTGIRERERERERERQREQFRSWPRPCLLLYLPMRMVPRRGFGPLLATGVGRATRFEPTRAAGLVAARAAGLAAARAWNADFTARASELVLIVLIVPRVTWWETSEWG